MDFIKILELLNEQVHDDAQLLTKFRVWCDANNKYVDNAKAVKQFASQFPDEAEKIEKEILSVITMRS